MSVIISRYVRDQDREARRARQRSVAKIDRRRERTHQTRWRRLDAQRVTCVACSGQDDQGNMYFGADGLVCASCFSDGDGQLHDDPAPGILRMVARPLAYGVLFAPWLCFQLGLGNPMARAVPWWQDALVVLSVSALVGAFLGSPWLLMNIAGDAKQDAHRPGLAVGQARWLVAGHAWHAVGFVGAVVGAFYTMRVLTA